MSTEFRGIGRAGNRAFVCFALGSISLGSACPVLYAGPKGEKVVRGDVEFFRDGSVTRIRASHNSIINYKSFDIASGEMVQFIQPGSRARVLNRIKSVDPTRIDGSLTANGIVYLVNPSGIVFGQGSIIDAGGIVAAAGNIANSDFLRNVDRFKGLSGDVINEGNISAQLTQLVGAHVANHGTIQSGDGLVLMIAGDKVLIGEREGHVFAKFNGKNKSNQMVGVENTGTIDAGRGEISLAAGDLYATAIFDDGQSRAARITHEGGKGGVVHEAGTLDASNLGPDGHGGSIDILGDKVGLFGATVDASGENGGGSIRIGGDLRGKGDVRNADFTFVDQGSTVRADALTNGDGGRVILWADDSARIYGNVSARGGAVSGDGGFIETSGKRYLEVAQAADVSSPYGFGGTWLLDPFNIKIVPGSGNININGSDPFESTGADAELGVDLIKAALTGGATVDIITGDGGGQNGNIVWQAAATLDYEGTGTNTLRLDADNKIEFKSIITDSIGGNTLNLELLAGGPVTINGLIDLGGGNFNSSGVTFATSNGAVIDTEGGDFILNHSGTVGLGDSSIRTGGGAVTIASTGGSIFIGDDAVDAGSGDISITATNDDIRELTNSTNVNLTTTGQVSLTAGGTIGTSSAALDIDTDDLVTDTSSGNGDQFINETDGLTAIDLNAGTGSITLNSGGAIADTDGNVDVQAGDADITANGAFGASGNAIGTTVGSLTVDTSAANGDQFIDETDGLTALDLNAGTGNVELTAGGAITDTDANADITGTSAAVTVTSGDFGTGANSINTDVDDLNVDTSTGNGDQFIDENDSLTALDLNAGTGSINLATGGAIADTDANADLTGGDATVVVGAGDFGSGANAIGTDVDGLSVDTSANNGDQFVEETDGLNNLDLDAGTGDVTLTANGSVLDSDANTDIAGTNAIVLLTSGDFGASGNAIDTNVADLSVDTTGGNGDQFINEVDGLTGLNLNAGTGNVELAAGGAITDTDANADITGTNATVTVASGGFGTGANSINTDVDDLSVDTFAGNGDQFIDENDGLTGLDLDAGTGNVELVAGGAIADSDASVDLAGGSADVTAGGAFGASGNEIGTDVDDLTVDTSGTNSDQFIDEADGLTGLNLEAGTGNIELMSGGTVADSDANADLTGTAATVVVTSGDFGSGANSINTDVDDLSVDTSAGNGDQFISEADDLTALDLNAGTGNIALATGGAIADVDANADLTGSNATVTLTTGDFGASGNAINTDVDSLSVDTSGGNGDQFIDEADDLTALNLNAGTGNVELTSGGSVTDADTDVDITGTSADVTLTAGNFGASGSPIETDVDTIDVDTSAGNGDQFVSDLDDLTVGVLDAGTGTVFVDSQTGALLDGNGASTNIIAGGTALQAATGINLDLDTDTVAANNTTSGDIDLDIDGAVSVGTVDTLAGITNTGGNVIVDVASPLTIDADVVAAGDIDLQATGSNASGDNLTINADITSTTGDTITLLAGDDIIHNSGTITSIAGAGARQVIMTADTEGAGVADGDRGSITQSAGAGINANEAVFRAEENIDLSAGSNTVGTIAANVGSGSFAYSDDSAVEVGTVDGVNGITTVGQSVTVNAASNLTVSQQISSSNGTVSLTSTAGNVQLADGAVDAGSGDVDITATTGNITEIINNTNTNVTTSGQLSLTAGGTIGASGSALDVDTDDLVTDTSSGNGNQFINESDGLTAIDLNAGTGGSITLTSGGAIADTDGNADIQAGTANVTANGAFGASGNEINTAVDNLTVDTSAADGDQFVNETNDLTSLTQTSGNGNIETTTGGAIAALNLNAGTGDVTLNAGGAVTDADANTDIAAANATVTVTSGDFGASGSGIDTDVNTLSVDTSAGNGNQFIDEANGLTSLDLISGNGNIEAMTGGNIDALDVNAGTGDVTLDAGGAIADTDANVDITAASADVTANGDFGASGNEIETDVDELSVDTSAANGDQFVIETDDLTSLTQLSGNGNIETTTGGAIAALNLDAGTGDVTLNASGSVSDADANTDIAAANATVMTGGTFGSGAGDIHTDVDTLDVTSSGDQFIEEADGLDSLTLTSNNGNIDADVNGAIAALDVNAGTGDVLLNADGSITDADGTTDIAAANATVTTGSTFGSGASDIHTDVDTLDVTSSGDQFIEEADNLDSLTLNSNNGNIDADVNGAIAALDVNAGTGDVLLNADGSITDADGSTDIEAANADVTAGGDFGASGQAIDTNVNDLTVNTSGANGDQFIDEVDGLTGLDLNAGTGDIELTAGGTVTDTDANDDLTGTNATVTLTGSDFGSSANSINTNVDDLSVDTSANNGDQFIDEANDLTGLNLNAGSGNITLETGGSVTDGDGNVDITAGSLNATIGGDFGASGAAIGTEVGSLTVDTSAANGDQFIDEQTGLSALNLDAGAGDVELTTGGDVTDADADADITATNATVNSGGVFGSGASDMHTDVDTLDVTSQGDQFIEQADNLTSLTLNSNNGNIDMDVNGAVAALDIDAGTGDVLLNADAAITDADGTTDIKGANATVTAGGNFGASGNAIGTDVTSLSVDTSGANGDQFVDELNGLNSLTQMSGNGNIETTTGGAISSLNVDAGTGDATLNAGGAITDTDSNVDINAANATVTAGGNFGSAANSINTHVNTLSVDTSGANGSQFIREADALTGLNLNAGTGNITLQTGGAIADADANADITGGNATVTAGGAFGVSGSEINTSVDDLSVNTASANGNQFITEANGLTSLNLDAGSGNVTLTSTAGSITDADANRDIRATNATLSAAGSIAGSGGNPNLHTDVDHLAATSTGGSVQVTNVGSLIIDGLSVSNNLDLRSTNGDLDFRIAAINAGGNVTLFANQGIGVSNVPAGRIILGQAGGGGFTLNAGGNITFGGYRSAVPSAASIFAPEGNLSITAGGDFLMGQNEKLTVMDGNLTINGTNMSLGDLTSKGAMDVNASGVVTFLLRDGAPLLIDPIKGTLTNDDAGLDFVSGGAMTFNAASYVNGDGNLQPQFASPGGGVTIVGSNAPTLIRVLENPVELNFINLSGRNEAPDLAASGVGAVDLSEALAGVAAIPEFEPEASLEIEQAIIQRLQRLNIHAVTPDESTYRSLIQQLVIINDLPEDLYEGVDTSTTVTRLQKESLLTALEKYDAINVDALRSDLESVLNGYVDSTGDPEVSSSDAFVAYLLSRREALATEPEEMLERASVNGAYEGLVEIGRVFDLLNESGLTRFELVRKAQIAMLQPIATNLPAGVRVEMLLEIVDALRGHATETSKD